MNRAFRADDVTGTDIRNPKDEHLGSVEDVVIDPNNGRISHVIPARGGVLGFGLNTTEDALEKAPKVDPEAVSDPQAYTRRRQEIDRFRQRREQNRAG